MADVGREGGVMSECEVSPDRAWEEQWSCNTHGVWWREGGEPDSCPAGVAEDEIDLLRAEVKRLRAVVFVAEGLNEQFVSALAHHDRRGKGGQQASFHGDFVSALQLPSVVQRMRWWTRRMAKALAALDGGAND